jgi:hypothetical protein
MRWDSPHGAIQRDDKRHENDEGRGESEDEGEHGRQRTITAAYEIQDGVETNVGQNDVVFIVQSMMILYVRQEWINEAEVN